MKFSFHVKIKVNFHVTMNSYENHIASREFHTTFACVSLKTDEEIRILYAVFFLKIILSGYFR